MVAAAPGLIPAVMVMPDFVVGQGEGEVVVVTMSDMVTCFGHEAMTPGSLSL